MATRDIVIRLRANVDDFRRQMGNADTAATTTLGRITQSAQKNRDAWNTSGAALTAFGALAVAGLAASARAAIQWESAWAGVTKTVSGTPRQLAEVETGLRGLARTMPGTHDEIAAVAEAAGQLGVKTNNIVGFTKTMVDLGNTTNLTADEAATSLAQLMNVMGTAPKDVGRLGASLVALGNAGASTEKDILNMASYFTGAAKLIGASESDVLALANAMTSMGINAERGGGVMTRVMQDVYTAVQTGGTQLDKFARVAGVSSEEFTRSFGEDPVRAIDTFVKGLGGIKDSGGNVVGTLADLGYRGTQDTAVLLQMMGAGNLLTESLDLGNKSWTENTALLAEAEKRYATTASQIAIAKNNIYDAAIEIGRTFLPAIASAAGGVSDFAQKVGGLPDPVKQVGASLGAIVGGAGLAAGGLILVVPRIIETYKAIQTLSTISPGATAALGKLGKAAGVAGIAFVALTAARSLGDYFSDSQVSSMESTTKALINMSGGLEDVNRLIAASGDKTDINWQFEGLADAAHKLNDNNLLGKITGSLGELLNMGGKHGLTEELNAIGASLGDLVASGHADVAAERFKMLGDEWVSGGGKLSQLRDLMPGYTEALDKVSNDQAVAAGTGKQLSDATTGVAGSLAGVAPAAESTYSSLETYASSLGMGKDATDELIKKSQELGQTLSDFVDPLGTYTALLDAKIKKEQEAKGQTADTATAGQESWQRFVNGAHISMDSYLKDLEKQVADQTNWQTNMLMLAGRVSAGTIAELAKMGPQGAPLVADLVNASDAELARFATVTAARSKGATDAWGEQLTLAQPVLAQIGRTAGQGVVDQLAKELAAGTTTVADIANKYGVSLANGVNPVLKSLGKPEVHLTVGGYVQNGRHLMAQGGVLGPEDHTAQIAPAGAWRVWAEEETGGEAYIPLSPAKRGRSKDIWREVGDRLGVRFEEFAPGGFYTPGDVPKPPSVAPYTTAVGEPASAAMQADYAAAVDFLTRNAASAGGSAGTVGGMDGIKAFIRSVDALPYVWGAVGPRGYDCSGLAGEILRLHLGMGGYSRMFTTGSFGNGARWGFKPGLGGTLSLGFNDHHVVGEYGGLGFEARSTATGIFTGGSATSPARMPRQFHLAGGGILDEEDIGGDPSAVWVNRHRGVLVDSGATMPGGILNPHVRDTGGPLRPGYTYNGTGREEYVLPVAPRDVHDGRRYTPAAPAAVAGVGVKGGDVTYNITATTPSENRQAQAIVTRLRDAQYAHGLATTP